jgi:hypothetical protein
MKLLARERAQRFESHSRVFEPLTCCDALWHAAWVLETQEEQQPKIAV